LLPDDAAPPPSREASVAQLLAAVRDGRRDALDQLFPLVYQELRELAHRQRLGWQGDDTLNTTALVHEAYLKLAHHGALEVNDRGHFFAVAARVMRQIVIDHVRSRAALRRGGDLQFASLDTTAMQAAATERSDELLALDAALDRLAAVDAQLAGLVEMRFYAGLELSEVAGVQERSERSLKRDWRRARAFLQREMLSA